jgi:hypothetical protein
MGLDQYALTSRQLDLIGDQQLDFVLPEGERIEVEDLHYWRKHPNMHGWMEALYRAKGGAAEQFNCQPLRLTLEDIDHLERDLHAGVLPYTTGFFFGASSPESYADDLAFIAKARAALREGKIVFYDSWW